MLHTNHKAHEAILAAQNADEYKAELVRFAHRFDFGTVCVITAIEQAGKKTEHYIENVPDHLKQQITHEVARRCPVNAHWYSSDLPLFWNRDTYKDANALDIFDVFADNGVHSGICLSSHRPNDGLHFGLSFDCAKEFAKEDSKQWASVLTELQLFSLHAQSTAFKLFVPGYVTESNPYITSTEAEILSWTYAGRTAYDASKAVKLSLEETTQQLTAVTQKLGCSNVHQAALKARHLRLI